MQQEHPRDHALRGAHSENPTFTCSKVGRDVCQPAPRRRQSSWHWEAAQLGPRRAGRGGSWQHPGRTPWAASSTSRWTEFYKTMATIKCQCFWLYDNLYRHFNCYGQSARPTFANEGLQKAAMNMDVPSNSLRWAKPSPYPSTTANKDSKAHRQHQQMPWNRAVFSSWWGFGC